MAAALACAAAAAAAPRWHVIGHATQSGSFLVTGASARTDRPASIEVKVTSSPRAGVGGNTLVDCDGKKVHGHVHGLTPIVRVLRLPVARPARCSVVANVTYAQRGTVTLTILAR